MSFLSSKASITKTRAAIIAIIITVAVVAVAWWWYAMLHPPAPPPPEKIKIGMPISLTGPYGEMGTLTWEGAQSWVEDINAEGGIYVKEYGRKLPVELIFYDDTSDMYTTIGFTKKLIIEDEVNILLAPYGSALTDAASAVSEEYEMLMVATTAASPEVYQKGYKYLIQVLSPYIYYMSGAVEMAKTADPTIKTLALLHGDDPYSIHVADSAAAKAEELGIEVVYRKTYPWGVEDLRPQLMEIKALNPDLLMGGAGFYDGILIARQLKELDIKPKLVCLRTAPAVPEWWDELGQDGNYFCAPVQWAAGVRYTPDFGLTNEQFVTRYKEMWVHGPDHHAASGYAAGLVIQRLIEEAGTLDSDALRQAANEFRFTSFWGDFKIDPETGLQVGHEMLIVQWQEGVMEIVWPQEVATAEICLPCSKSAKI